MHTCPSAFNDADLACSLRCLQGCLRCYRRTCVFWGFVYQTWQQEKRDPKGPFFVCMRFSVTKSLIAYVLTSGLTTTWSIDECGVSNLLRRGSV